MNIRALMQVDAARRLLDDARDKLQAALNEEFCRGRDYDDAAVQLLIQSSTRVYEITLQLKALRPT